VSHRHWFVAGYRRLILPRSFHLTVAIIDGASPKTPMQLGCGCALGALSMSDCQATGKTDPVPTLKLTPSCKLFFDLQREPDCRRPPRTPSASRRSRRQRPWAARRHATTRPLLRHLQALLTPQAIHPVGPERVPLALEKDADRAVAVPRTLAGQRAQGLEDGRIAGDQPRHLRDRGSRDGEQGARVAARQTA